MRNLSQNAHPEPRATLATALYIGVHSGQFVAYPAWLGQCGYFAAAQANPFAVQPVISGMTPEARNPPSTAIHWPVT
jgi:hypothetical protein